MSQTVSMSYHQALRLCLRDVAVICSICALHNEIRKAVWRIGSLHYCRPCATRRGVA